jgi:hypothetical protein
VKPKGIKNAEKINKATEKYKMLIPKLSPNYD